MKTLIELGPFGAWLVIAAMGLAFANARKGFAPAQTG